MKTSLLRRARRHFSSDVLTRQQNRANQRKWIRMIRLLGDKWLAIPKEQQGDQHA